MNASRLAVTLFVLVASGASAWARIGESEAQIAARYGTSIGDIPTETFGPVRGYVTPGFVVGVKLVDGVSQMEMLAKSDQSGMSATEIAGLLKAHGADEQWNPDPFDRPNWSRWRSQDGSLVAVYDMRRHFLYIQSRKFYEELGRRLGN
jgi:hypothetical protein